MEAEEGAVSSTEIAQYEHGSAEDATIAESTSGPVPAPFRVDVSLIPQAASKDAGALEELGLWVFNQEDLEAGVVAQAEHRMEEESQRVAQQKRYDIVMLIVD